MTIGNLGIMLALSVIFFLLTVWALVDVSMKTFPSMGEKAAWWIIALLPFIGWLVYFIFGARRGRKADYMA